MIYTTKLNMVHISPLKNSWHAVDERNSVTVGHTVEGIFHISYYFIAMK